MYAMAQYIEHDQIDWECTSQTKWYAHGTPIAARRFHIIFHAIQIHIVNYVETKDWKKKKKKKIKISLVWPTFHLG